MRRTVVAVVLSSAVILALPSTPTARATTETEGGLAVVGTVQPDVNAYRVALCTESCINVYAGEDVSDIGVDAEGRPMSSGDGYFPASLEDDYSWSVEVPPGAYRLAVGYAYPDEDSMESMVYVLSGSTPYTTSSFEDAQVIDVSTATDLGEVTVVDVETSEEPAPWRTKRLSWTSGCPGPVEEASWEICFKGKVLGSAGKGLKIYLQVGYCDGKRPRWQTYVRQTTTDRGVFDFADYPHRRRYHQRSYDTDLNYERAIRDRVFIPASAGYAAFEAQGSCVIIGGS